MKYFYTYRLPFKPNLKFDYWKCKDADECLGKAFSKYKTTNFYIGTTTRAEYNKEMGIKTETKKSIKLTENQIETLRCLISDPTKFENMSNKDYVKWGLKDLMKQLNTISHEIRH